jgi:hypothetical protein
MGRIFETRETVRSQKSLEGVFPYGSLHELFDLVFWHVAEEKVGHPPFGGTMNQVRVVSLAASQGRYGPS